MNMDLGGLMDWQEMMDVKRLWILLLFAILLNETYLCLKKRVGSWTLSELDLGGLRD